MTTIPRLGCGAPATPTGETWAGVELAWCPPSAALPARRRLFYVYEVLARRRGQASGAPPPEAPPPDHDNLRSPER